MEAPKPTSRPPMELGAPALEIGAYTEIIGMSAPSEAGAGEEVEISVTVKNLARFPIYISVSGKYDDNIYYLYPEYVNVAAGGSHAFTGSFIMPSKDVRVYAWSFYWTGEDWYQDDSRYVDIALAAPPEVYAGTISRKELEYDESRANIPAYDVPQNERGLVHIWGRNDTTKNQSLGIGWVVTDPEGAVVEIHENDWAFGWVGPGQDREFIGGRFNFDKIGTLGTYSIAISLYMNSANPVEVDTYSGALCTVTPVAEEPSFSNLSASYRRV